MGCQKRLPNLLFHSCLILHTCLMFILLDWFKIFNVRKIQFCSMLFQSTCRQRYRSRLAQIGRNLQAYFFVVFLLLVDTERTLSLQGLKRFAGRDAILNLTCSAQNIISRNWIQVLFPSWNAQNAC